MRCSLNNHPEGYTASPLRWLGGLVLSPYVKRHWNLSDSQKDHRWSHRAIAVIQAIPFGIGLAASLLERVIVFFAKSQGTTEASQKTNTVFKKTMDQKVKPEAVSKSNELLLDPVVWGGKIERLLDSAVIDGDVERCRKHLDEGALINALNRNCATALIRAAHYGHKEICELLIDRGADVNMENIGKQTALSEAAYFGHKEICKLLIDSGADVNIADAGGQTALMRATGYGHKEICELLIDRGADVNMENINGKTALMLAAQLGHEELARMLFDKDPKVLKKRPNILQFVDVPSAKEKYKLKSQKERLIKQLALVWDLGGTINSYSGPLRFEGEYQLFSDRLVKDLWSKFCIEFQEFISEELSEKIGKSLDVFESKDIKNYLDGSMKSDFLFNIGYKNHAAYMWMSDKKVIIFDGGGHGCLNKILFNKKSPIFFGTYSGKPMRESLMKRMTALKDLDYHKRIDSMKEIVMILDIVGDRAKNSVATSDRKRYPFQRVGNCTVHNKIYALKSALDYSELSSEARFFAPALRALVLENFIDSYKFDPTDPVDQQMLPYLCQIRSELSTELCIDAKRKGMEVLAGSQHSEERFKHLQQRVSEKFDKASDGWKLPERSPRKEKIIRMLFGRGFPMSFLYGSSGSVELA